MSVVPKKKCTTCQLPSTFVYISVALIVVVVAVFIYHMWNERNCDGDGNDDGNGNYDGSNNGNSVQLSGPVMIEMNSNREVRSFPVTSISTKGIILTATKFKVAGKKGNVWTLSPEAPKRLIGRTVIANGYLGNDSPYFIIDSFYSAENPHRRLYSSQETLIE